MFYDIIVFLWCTSGVAREGVQRGHAPLGLICIIVFYISTSINYKKVCFFFKKSI